MKNDFIISGIENLDNESLEHLKNTNELVIINSKEIYFMKQKVQITSQAYKLLRFLAQNPNIAHTRTDCISNTWGVDYSEGEKTLYNNTSELRKIFKNTAFAKCIIAQSKTIKFEFDNNLIYLK